MILARVSGLDVYTKKLFDLYWRLTISLTLEWWSAKAGDHRLDFAWGHGGQFIVLEDDIDMVIVLTSYPFWLEHNEESWKYEKANLNLVANFIKSLPGE